MIKTPDWVREAVIYQIFPDRFYNGSDANDPPGIAEWGEQPSRDNYFGGDLEGIAQKLDYIQSLGVNTIYLTPIFSAPSNHKYDTRDYYQVDDVFGGASALNRLLLDMHQRGMKLILDGVFNHCGEEFFAFQDVLKKGKSSTFSNWFNIFGYPLSKNPLNYNCCGDASYLPKLNHANPEVNEYFLEVGKYWIEEFDIDGWRLDVPFKIQKRFWKDFRKIIKTAKKDTFLFGEVWRDGRTWVNGETFDGFTNYSLRGLILDYCMTEFLDAEDYLYEANALRESLGDAAYCMVNLLGSHDTTRLLTIFDEDVNRALLAWVLLLTEVGIPLIYYGDEVGMLGNNDPDCRRTMIWEENKKNTRIYNTIRSLISLRENSKALTNGTFESLFSFVGVAAYKRHYQNEEIIVVMNARDDVHNIRIPVRSTRTTYYDYPSKNVVNVKDGEILFSYFPACDFKIFTSKIV